MSRVADALREAAFRLGRISDSARLDAELLMAEALGASRSEMVLRHMHAAVPESFDRLVARREQHEPVAYIIGRKEFYGREFAVSRNVLIPRMDSETIVEAALRECPSPRSVLDCGVGSGALLLTVLAERPGAKGIGFDRCEAAIAVARENAQRLGLVQRAHMVIGDWDQPGWADALEPFDLILANPPYVEEDAAIEPDVRKWEPAGALFAGAEGLDAYRVLVPQLPSLLTTGGAAVVEIGAAQAEQVTEIAASCGFGAELRRDLAGRPRALVLRLRLGK